MTESEAYDWNVMTIIALLKKPKYLQQFTGVDNQTSHPHNTPFTYYKY